MLSALVLTLVSCAGPGVVETAPSITSEADATAPSTAEEPPSAATNSDGAVTNLVDVRSAVVRIESTGSFAYPDSGTQYNEGLTGSGFFISSDGLAVTNNHVVTGAGFLKVFIAGEDEPRNARVLGASECSDLAVIDVEGDGFSYLSWYTGAPVVGTDVYAAGFPLGDAEYTLLDGIISKESADGESSWSSVDSVIEHTADILGGSSGGPLVTTDGKVVGVVYAGDDQGQAFAIGYSEVERVLPSLRMDLDVNSIGVNGTAILEDGTSGIWVHSVEPGSPADLIGVRAADIITELSGLIPGADGTMSDYCDVLRSHDLGDAIQIEVWRDGEGFWEGTLNTEKVLAPLETQPSPTSPTTSGETKTPEYSLQVGDCIDDVEVDEYVAANSYSTVSCSTPHDNEVYFLYEYPAGPYPGDDAAFATLREVCLENFDSHVDREYLQSALDVAGITPSKDLWDNGERIGECLLYDLEYTLLTGSAFQSGW